jgi:hypothetical protein
MSVPVSIGRMLQAASCLAGPNLFGFKEYDGKCEYFGGEAPLPVRNQFDYNFGPLRMVLRYIPPKKISILRPFPLLFFPPSMRMDVLLAVITLSCALVHYLCDNVR